MFSSVLVKATKTTFIKKSVSFNLFYQCNNNDLSTLNYYYVSGHHLYLSIDELCVHSRYMKLKDLYVLCDFLLIL